MTTVPSRVITENEVSIAGNFYRLTRPVQAVLASQYPAKVLIGDITGDSQQHLSAIRWSDARGGIGKKDHAGAADATRLWYSTSHLRVQGHRTLPDLATTTAQPQQSRVGAMADLANAVYAAFATKVFKYTYATNSWGTAVHTLPAIAKDAIRGRWGGTVYMVFAHTGGYSYTTNGTTWVDNTTDVLYLADWDDRIWGIDNVGQLRWAFDPTGTWTDDAQLSLENGTVQDLFVARDATGEPVLYVSTKVGLFVHDYNNNRLIKTDMELPFHPYSGDGVARWRDSTYIPAGLGIYKYNVTGGSAVISLVGPDRDQGMPSGRRGRIMRLESTHNDLVALVQDVSESPASGGLIVTGGFSSHVGGTPWFGGTGFNADTGVSTVLAYNEIGWQVLWESGVDEVGIDTSLVSYAYDGYRLWFAQNQKVHYVSLPVDILNPAELTSREYATSSKDEYPWFDGGQSEVDKLAVRIIVEVSDATTTETVTPYYALNYDDTTWTALGIITAPGRYTYELPNIAYGSNEDAEGVEFRAIRFRTDLARGGTITKSPDVNSLTLEYRKKLPPRFGWNVEIDMNDYYKGYTPRQQADNILSAVKSNKRIQFTFRDDDSNERNFWGDIIQLSGMEFTGHKEGGITRLVVTEL